MKKFNILSILSILLYQVACNGDFNTVTPNNSIQYSQVEIGDRRGIEKSLAAIFHDGFQSEDVIYPLLDGKSQDRLYCGTIENRKIVFKFVAWPDDYIRQYFYSEMAAQKQLGPKILYNNEEDKLFVMEFVEGIHLSSNVLEDNAVLCQFSQAMYDIHHADPLNVEIAFDIFERAEKMILSHQEKKIENYSDLVECQPFIHSMKAAIENRNIPPKPSHNDLHPLNVFYDNDKRIKFIDWGNAALSDPFYDLACISVAFGLSKEQADLFLKNYFDGSISDADRAHFFLMQNMVIFKYICSFRRLETIDSGTKGRVLACCQRTLGIEEINECATPQDIAEIFLDVFKKRVHSAEFNQSLDLLSQ